VLCAVTSRQTRFACHWISQGHSTVSREPTARRESPSRDPAPVSGFPSSMGSGPLEVLDQRGERYWLFFYAKLRGFLVRQFQLGYIHTCLKTKKCLGQRSNVASAGTTEIGC